jgi:hypothetical protein
MSRAVRLPLVAVGLLVPAQALAVAPGSAPDSNEVNYAAPPTERRGGFAMGVQSGVSLVDFSGYPNEAGAIGDPAALAATGPSLGFGFTFWVGGAFRDFVAMGVGLTSTGPLGGDYLASNAGFVLHFEGYPLYALGSRFRDLGLSFDGGPGVGVMFDSQDTKGETPLAMGGGMSFVGAGVFYEPVQFWQMSFGPALNFTTSFSQTMTVNQAMLGIRFSFYGDQPKEKSANDAAAGSRDLF